MDLEQKINNFLQENDLDLRTLTINTDVFPYRSYCDITGRASIIIECQALTKDSQSVIFQTDQNVAVHMAIMAGSL